MSAPGIWLPGARGPALCSSSTTASRTRWCRCKVYSSHAHCASVVGLPRSPRM